MPGSAPFNPATDLLDVYSAQLNTVAEVKAAVIILKTLTAGTGVTIVDNGDGTVTINCTATGGGTYTLPYATATVLGGVMLANASTYPVAPSDPLYDKLAITPAYLDLWWAAHSLAGGGDLLEWCAAPDEYLYVGFAQTAAGIAALNAAYPNQTKVFHLVQVPFNGGARHKVRFTVTGGALPPGCVLDFATGFISQVAATAVGTYTFQVTATDGAQTIVRQFKITITSLTPFTNLAGVTPLFGQMGIEPQRTGSALVLKVGDDLDAIAQNWSGDETPILSGTVPDDLANFTPIPRAQLTGLPETIWFWRGPTGGAQTITGTLPPGSVVRWVGSPVVYGQNLGGVLTATGYFKFGYGGVNYFVKVNPATGAPLA